MAVGDPLWPAYPLYPTYGINPQIPKPCDHCFCIRDAYVYKGVGPHRECCQCFISKAEEFIMKNSDVIYKGGKQPPNADTSTESVSAIPEPPETSGRPAPNEGFGTEADETLRKEIKLLFANSKAWGVKRDLNWDNLLRAESIIKKIKNSESWVDVDTNNFLDVDTAGADIKLTPEEAAYLETL